MRCPTGGHQNGKCSWSYTRRTTGRGRLVYGLVRLGGAAVQPVGAVPGAHRVGPSVGVVVPEPVMPDRSVQEMVIVGGHRGSTLNSVAGIVRRHRKAPASP